MQTDEWRIVKDPGKSLADIHDVADIDNLSFSQWVGMMLQSRRLAKSTVIRNSCLHPTYAYQIMAGSRKATRDKLLQLAFGAGLDIDETNELLERGGANPLSPHRWRDIAIAYCLERKMTVPECSEVLRRAGLEGLQQSRRPIESREQFSWAV